ncbi:MAG: hypothetical protein CK425_02000 [Parachlamydia sp.]|nr:MAG: hypothetical protein CK425_02000 [Parachlamydia sp.]
MVNALAKCGSLSELDQLLAGVNHTVIGRGGGRKILIEGSTSSEDKEYSLNQVAKKLFTLCKKSDYSKKECEVAVAISEKIAVLNADKTYKKKLTKGEKAYLWFRRLGGNLPGIGLRSSQRSQEQLKAICFSMMYLHYARESTKLRHSFLKQAIRQTGTSEVTSQKIAEKTENIAEASKILNAKFVKKIQKDTDRWKQIEARFAQIRLGGF